MAVSDSVFISDLPDGMDDASVKNLFGAYGNVTWCKATQKGKGKGSAALVTFADTVDSSWFVENLNGNIPEGLETAIKVAFSPSKGGKAGKDNGGKGGYGKADGGKSAWGKDASPYGKGKGAEGGKGGKGGKGGDVEINTKGLIKGAMKGGILPSFPGERPLENQLYVRGLPSDCTDRDVYELFAPFGAIPPKGILTKQQDGACTGVAFVDFLEAECAAYAAQSLNGFEAPDGSALQVTIKRANGDSKGKGKGKEKGKDKGKGKKW
jgi:RNA recognition motif-containing protein